MFHSHFFETNHGSCPSIWCLIMPPKRSAQSLIRDLQRRLDNLEIEVAEQDERIDRLDRSNIHLQWELSRIRRGARQCPHRCMKEMQVSPDAWVNDPRDSGQRICVAQCHLDAGHAGACSFLCSSSCPSWDCTHCFDANWARNTEEPWGLLAPGTVEQETPAASSSQAPQTLPRN